MGLARAITQFRRNEIIALLKAARLVLRTQELDIRAASSFQTPLCQNSSENSPNCSESYSRVLIIIPRAVGNAPERNLLRRRIKSIFYEEKIYTFPYDFVIFLKKESKKLSFEQLKQYILDAKNKIIAKNEARS